MTPYRKKKKGGKKKKKNQTQKISSQLTATSICRRKVGKDREETKPSNMQEFKGERIRIEY